MFFWERGRQDLTTDAHLPNNGTGDCRMEERNRRIDRDGRAFLFRRAAMAEAVEALDMNFTALSVPDRIRKVQYLGVRQVGGMWT